MTWHSKVFCKRAIKSQQHFPAEPQRSSDRSARHFYFQSNDHGYRHAY
jgi:hypothetical protein